MFRSPSSSTVCRTIMNVKYVFGTYCISHEMWLPMTTPTKKCEDDTRQDKRREDTVNTSWQTSTSCLQGRQPAYQGVVSLHMLSTFHAQLSRFSNYSPQAPCGHQRQGPAVFTISSYQGPSIPFLFANCHHVFLCSQFLAYCSRHLHYDFT